jgi:DNA adenine methylase
MICNYFLKIFGQSKMSFYSPLRYPGGKKKLAGFIQQLMRENQLLDSVYIEPFAGGSNVALTLLFEEYARTIIINDIDQSIYAFWYSVLYHTDELSKLITDTQINMENWKKSKEMLANKDASLLEKGFATFFLNRTNRSGIITGGVIGGKAQDGKWKLDARFNKPDLLERIEKIARYKERIQLFNLDAIEFIKQIMPTLPNKSLTYFDPPYYVKGTQLLYMNYYLPDDHQLLSDFIKALNISWLVSYDNVQEIRELYLGFRHLEYSLNYSAQKKYAGKEIIYFSNNLSIPQSY